MTIEPKRLSVKLLLDNPNDVELTSVVPIFHDWIRDGLLPGVLLDVADYKHVADGPGILLIGHEYDVQLDRSYSTPGLKIVLKAGWRDQPLTERVSIALRLLLRAAVALHEAPGFSGRFASGQIEIALIDRLASPNERAAFRRMNPVVQSALQRVYGDRPVRLVRLYPDVRRLLIIGVTVTDAPPLASLLVGHALVPG